MNTNETKPETVSDVESLADALATAHTQWGAKSSETRGSLYAHMARSVFERVERVERASATGSSGLHPKTADLVRRFAEALAEKLAAAERKYGYSDDWASPDWMDECRQKLLQHVAKGDPRDVAAYSMFLWHHGERTASLTGDAEPAGNAIDGLLATARPFLAEEMLVKQGYTWDASGKWVAPTPAPPRFWEMRQSGKWTPLTPASPHAEQSETGATEWASKSMRHLAKMLRERGDDVSTDAASWLERLSASAETGAAGSAQGDASLAQWIAADDAAWALAKLAVECGAEDCATDGQPQTWALGVEAFTELARRLGLRDRPQDAQGDVEALVKLWRGPCRTPTHVTGPEWNGFRSALSRCADELEAVLRRLANTQPATADYLQPLRDAIARSDAHEEDTSEPRALRVVTLRMDVAEEILRRAQPAAVKDSLTDAAIASLRAAIKSCDAPMLTEKCEQKASWDAVSFVQSHGKSVLTRLTGGSHE